MSMLNPAHSTNVYGKNFKLGLKKGGHLRLAPGILEDGVGSASMSAIVDFRI